MFAVISALSLFVLATFFVSGLNGPARWNSFSAQDAPQGRKASSSKTSSSQTRDSATGDKYLLGVGKADITGPVVEIEFAGYASASQTGTGLRQRIYSRAFIVGDVDSPEDRFVYIIVDAASGDTAMRNGVLEALADLGDEYAVYGSSNLALTGTHSHSGPGAWWNYLLPQITSLGFDHQSYQAIVDGVVLSIQRAHEALDEVSLSLLHASKYIMLTMCLCRDILILVSRTRNTSRSFSCLTLF